MPEEYMKCYDRIMTPDGTFKKISRWTSSASIECEDGKLLEEKLNDISGITSDLNCADEKIAASAKAANTLYKTTIDLNGKVSECFQSVSDGKKLLAAAITDKGINTAATDDFSRMAQNIKGLITMSTDPNVLFNTMSWTAPKNCIAVMSFTFTMDCASDYKQTARIYLKFLLFQVLFFYLSIFWYKKGEKCHLHFSRLNICNFLSSTWQNQQYRLFFLYYLSHIQ